MVSILILLILAWVFYIGYSRGLLLQVYYTAASVVAMMIAGQHYQNLAKTFSLWVPYSSAVEGARTYFYSNSQLFDLDKVFYAGLAYLVIYTIVYSLARLVGILVHLLPRNFFDNMKGNIISGLLAAGVALFAVEMVLTLLSTVPLTFIQEHLNQSGLARFIIQHTPVTSAILRNLWVTQIIG